MTDTEQSQTLVEKVDDLAQVMGLDVKELHELHKAVSRRVTRIFQPWIPRASAIASAASHTRWTWLPWTENWQMRNRRPSHP